jgi:Flp pilus assembly protein CpaB
VSTGILLGDPYKPTRSRWLSRALLGVGVALSLIAAMATYFFATTPRSETPTTGLTVGVLVAARDVDARTALGDGDLKIVQLPRDATPASALRDKAAAVGRITTVALAANEPVLPGKIAASGSEGNIAVFPAGTQPGGTTPRFRAVSLNVPDANAAGGNIQPGDRVDVLLTWTAPSPDGKTSDAVSRVAIDNVTVLAHTITVYTVRLDVDAAERLAALQAGGAAVELLLRGPGDDRSSGSGGASFTRETQRLLRP